MDFKEQMRLLKIHFKVFTNKELAVKMGLSEDGIKNWIRNKAIPKKHLKLLEKDNNIEKNNINGNNNINLNGINNSQIHINGNNDLEHKICESVKKLSDKRKMYYYHKIEAELLEDE